MAKAKESKIEAIGDPTNDASRIIAMENPYTAFIKIQGAAPLLFHSWSCDAVEVKAKAKKGSDQKKSDDLESYVRRNEKGEICLPSEYLRMAIINAAKFFQDPRSPRKSAMDLFKAGIYCIEELCSLGTKEWDYLDRRRVVIQRSGITRVRPAMKQGWIVECPLGILLPEYISQDLLNEVTQKAGRLVGVGDFRPTFGRFNIVGFEVSNS